MKKKDFLALHVQDVETDPKSGRKKRVLRYIGAWYPIDRAQVRRCLPVVWGTLLLALVTFVTAGLTPAQGQRCPYVVPFYMLTLLPLYQALMAAWRVTRITGDRISEMQKQEGVLSLIHNAAGLMALSLAWLAGESVMLCLRGVTGDSEWLFLICAAVQSAAATMLFLRVRGIRIGEAQTT